MLFDRFEFFEPAQEAMRGSVRFLPRCSTLHGVKDLISLIDARPKFLLPSEADGVVKMTNDAAIPQAQLRREVKCEGHGRITEVECVGSANAAASTMTGTFRRAKVYINNVSICRGGRDWLNAAAVSADCGKLEQLSSLCR
jgi:hypothetical protein